MRDRLAAIAAVLLAVQSLPAAAEPRHAAIILDANSGAVLHAQAADELRHPASLTKMMTLYMAFELIEMGRLNYSTKIKVTQEAAAAAPTKLDLEPGEEIALVDAMKALVTKSANDMAIAIAQTIAGSEANFARLMTEKARQLGMKSTVFRNASGLPDPEQVTTARDMIALALHLQDDFPKHYHLFGLRSFTYNGETYRNHNTLLNSYRGTDGIKTGYTRASGFNLVASVRRDGKHLVGAIFGGETAAARNAHLRVLLDRAFPKASTQKARKPALVAKAAPPPTRAHRPAAIAAAKPEAPVTVAQAAPPPQPKPASRPAVARAAAPPPTATTAAPAPAVAVAPAQVAPAEAKPAAFAVADSGATAMPAGVEVAKVRRVMVAPHVRARPASSTAQSEEAAAAQTMPREKPAEQPVATPQPAPLETVVAKAPAPVARPPSSFQEQVAALAANLAPAAFLQRDAEARADASAGAGAESTPASPPPGAPPSTLAAQAAALDAAVPPRQSEPRRQVAAATPPPAYRLAGPEPRAEPAAPIPPTASGAFQIQVGAYGSVDEAQRQIATVSATAPPVVGGHAPLTLAVTKGTRQLYRARFAGFDANGAASACLELRRRQIDCFVMKAE